MVAVFCMIVGIMSSGVLGNPTHRKDQSGLVASRVRPFDLTQVQLLAGPFQQARKLNPHNLLKFDLNLLCYPLRHVAHLPSPVKGSNALNWRCPGQCVK